MSKLHASVVINEVEVEPLSDYVIDFLMTQKKECPYLDFKYTIHVQKGSDFPELAKDIFAFANYGGGWILIGWKEQTKNVYIPVGLPQDYQVDQSVIQEKFNAFTNTPIEIHYKEIEKEINGEIKRLAIIFIPPSYNILNPTKEGKYSKGQKERTVFKKGDIFYRRGTQSIPPSKYELGLINKRLETEKYRISLISGEPDQIGETLTANIFEVVKMPEYVYLGDKEIGCDDVTIKALLKQEGVFPEFFHKFKEWNKKIVTFDNLMDGNNPYSQLVIDSTVTRERVGEWIQDPDKNRIIIELLNRELKHYAISKKLYYFRDKNKFYFTTEQQKRRESWKSRYGRSSTRVVAARMYAQQIKQFIYCHTAFNPSFVQIGNKFYLQIIPSFVITEDGKKPMSSFKVGTIITRLSYNKYNDSYRNTILFWIYQLKNRRNIFINDYLEISPKPVTTELPYGIIFDIPSKEFKLDIGGDEEEELQIEGDDYEL